MQTIQSGKSLRDGRLTATILRRSRQMTWPPRCAKIERLKPRSRRTRATRRPNKPKSTTLNSRACPSGSLKMNDIPAPVRVNSVSGTNHASYAAPGVCRTPRIPVTSMSATARSTVAPATGLSAGRSKLRTKDFVTRPVLVSAHRARRHWPCGRSRQRPRQPLLPYRARLRSRLRLP